MMARTLRVLATAAVLLLTATSCGDSGNDESREDATPDDAPSPLRVGGFDFPESELLAELYSQALESAGVEVDRLGVVGSREIVAPALEQDQLDLVPEYLGTATTYFSAGDMGEPKQALTALRTALEPRGLVALEPARATNTNVFVVSADSGLGPRISDLAGDAPTLRFGGPPECRDRPLCFAGLRTVYGLEFAEFVTQPSLPITAEALRRDEIDVGLMFSTDAALTDEFLVLADDLSLQAAENIVPVIRREALDRWGDERINEALDPISAALTTDELRALNQRVAAGDGAPVVAAEWLADHTPALAD